MESFSTERFLADLERTCNAISAPYNKAVTERVIRTFNSSFHRGAVLWRATDRAGDALNYRFYERQPVDLLKSAIHAEFLKLGHPLVFILQRWSTPWSGGVPEQSCDFDPEKGLTKAWAYQAGFRPLHDLLSMDGIPQSIRQHEQIFHHLGLDTVRHVAVDFPSTTVNFYFRISESLSSTLVARLVQLAQSSPPSSAEFQVMQKYVNPTGFTFAVTVYVPTGAITRVAFYALGLSPDSLPDLGDRLNTFFREAPSYDEETFIAIAWSFGTGGEKYIKAEKSYCGEVVPLVRGWSSNLTSDRGDAPTDA